MNTDTTYDSCDPTIPIRKRLESMSQKDLAEELGVSAAYLNDILFHRRQPGKKILKALGLKRVILYVPE
jgi:transcriptional regulator with XRE-family HTH domain